jgi:uncharacterized protein (TIGR02284 family)
MSDHFIPPDGRPGASHAELELLHGLIRVCKDGENGFRTAADHVKDLTLRQAFEQQSRERAEFADELLGMARREGASFGAKGDFAGALHCGWMNLKAAVLHNDQAILAECVRGENVAIRVYDEALQRELSGHVRALVERQYLHLRDAHDFVRSFETVEPAN